MDASETSIRDCTGGNGDPPTDSATRSRRPVRSLWKMSTWMRKAPFESAVMTGSDGVRPKLHRRRS